MRIVHSSGADMRNYVHYNQQGEASLPQRQDMTVPVQATADARQQRKPPQPPASREDLSQRDRWRIQLLNRLLPILCQREIQVLSPSALQEQHMGQEPPLSRLHALAWHDGQPPSFPKHRFTATGETRLQLPLKEEDKLAMEIRLSDDWPGLVRPPPPGPWQTHWAAELEEYGPLPQAPVLALHAEATELERENFIQIQVWVEEEAGQLRLLALGLNPEEMIYLGHLYRSHLVHRPDALEQGLRQEQRLYAETPPPSAHIDLLV